MGLIIWDDPTIEVTEEEFFDALDKTRKLFKEREGAQSRYIEPSASPPTSDSKFIAERIWVEDINEDS